MRLLLAFLFTFQFALGQTPEVKLFDFKSSTCDSKSDPGILRTRIISKELHDDILTIQIAATATCCVDFNPITKYENGILHLDIEETGTACECFCCYEFIYQIKGILNDAIRITFRNKDIEQSDEKFNTFPIQYEVVNGDTVNLIDKYGLRQGTWILAKDTLIKVIYELVDDHIIKMTKYYANGQVMSEVSSEKVKHTYENEELFEFMATKYVEYYESGALKKECYNDNKKLYRDGKCKEWNEQGELVYEGDFRE